MAGILAPTEKCLQKHTAVRLNNCILVLSNILETALWIYNLWAEQWAKHAIPECKEPPYVNGQTGVAIGTEVYIFGGRKNTLLKLTRNANGSFVWSVIHTDKQTKAPSARYYPCAWGHG